MKTPICLTRDLSDIGQATPLVLPATIRATTIPKRPTQKEGLRHILLGSPSAIRQTIYLLHSLNYAEPALWSPIMTADDNYARARRVDEFVTTEFVKRRKRLLCHTCRAGNSVQ